MKTLAVDSAMYLSFTGIGPWSAYRSRDCTGISAVARDPATIMLRAITNSPDRPVSEKAPTNHGRR
jgi:hypothetical protein